MSSNPSVREWFVGPSELGVVDPDEIAQMAVDVATVQRMCGGTATSGAMRDQDPQTGEWLTVGMWWRWHPFAPGVAAPGVEQPQQQPQQQTNGQGGRKRRRRNRGGNGQPPQDPEMTRAQPQVEIAQAGPQAVQSPAFFENQPEPEPQEPPEVYGEDIPSDEFIPLTPEQEQELREEGLLPQ